VWKSVEMREALPTRRPSEFWQAVTFDYDHNIKGYLTKVRHKTL
jgi:hypothetical protein